MKPTKVCFVSLLAYPLFNPSITAEFGGAEVQLYYLATELAKDPRFDIAFLTGDFGQPAFEMREGVKLYKLARFPRGIKYIRTVIEYARLAMLIKKLDADLCIQRAAAMLTGVTALTCKFSAKKFVYMTAHDQDVMKERPGWMPKGIIGFIVWALFGIGIRMADFVIVQNQKQKENLKRLYNKDGYVRPSAHRISENSEISVKQLILWVARCEDWKQPELFLDLAKEFPGELFCMVCPRSLDEKYFVRIKELAAGLANVQFVEFVPFKEIDTFFSRARVFVNTSKKEGFPNTFIQALKNKTPVLSLNVDPDGILEKYNFGRCSHGNIDRLKIDLGNMLRDDRLWQAMSESAYTYVIARHDIKKIIEEDKKIILGLTKNH
ncbi:MAG: glycosyltransferase family 4 protein [Nitrospirae bacterium]|nr:glycosyltransferase family 4 protein [Nitrospirota bacterium]